MPQTRKYVITVERPDRVSDAEMRAYISDAVKALSGSFSPSDPLWGMRERVQSVVNYGSASGKS
jgi:hypothetical protein